MFFFILKILSYEYFSWLKKFTFDIKIFVECNILHCKVIILWFDCWITVTDFSVSAWISSNSYTPTLLDYQALELMNEMKAARYLLETPCDLTASTGIYSNPVDGWNKCKHTVFIVQDTFYIAVTCFEDETCPYCF